MFDPYRKWLGIPDGPRPPTHYQLLGISPDEHDRDVINAAVLRQSSFVRHFQTGERSQEATRLLNEIAAAKLCLLDAAKRAEYDRQFNRAVAPPPANQPAAPSVGQPRPSSSSLSPPPAVSHPRPPAPATISAPGQAATYSYAPPASRPAPSLVPDAVWSATASPSAAPVETASQTKGQPPVWLWLIPAGSLGLLVVVLLMAGLTWGPSDASDGQVSLADSASPASPVTQTVSNQPVTPIAKETVPPSSSRPLPPPKVETTRSPISPPTVDATPPTVDATPPATADFGKQRPIVSPPGMSGPSSATPDNATASPNPFSPFSEDATWSDGSTFSIAAPHNAEIVFARGRGPFVAVGGNVYSLADGHRIGQAEQMPTANMPGGIVPRGIRMTALSPDGRYFAFVDRDMVEVRRCEYGQIASRIDVASKSIFIQLLDFAGPDKLVVSMLNGGEHHVQIWNIPAGTLVRDFEIDGGSGRMTLSEDGRYLAVVVNQFGIVIYDLQKNPSKKKGSVAARIRITNPSRRTVDVESMCFSPSGEELAAICDNWSRVMCWDKRTNLVFEHELGADLLSFWTGAMAYRGPDIEWHPGGRGWLLKGNAFLDRKLRRITWLLKTGNDFDARHRFIDEESLLALRGHWKDRELVDVKIPWEKIDDSLAAMQDASVPAWLGPQQPVGIRIQVGSLAGGTSAPQIESDLRQLLTARLAADGIRISDDGEMQYLVDYSEEYRAPRAVFPPNRGPSRINRPATQFPGHMGIKMVIRLRSGDSASDLWSNTLSAGMTDDNSQSQRQAINAAIERNLKVRFFPYFMPKGSDLLSLPVVIQP
ncbi:MAG TPA: hypothetical protein VHC22_28120 [Pirellulales bacterium]|nr:hypothetical protein [Pirellulales bacterium]